ncbi:MAG: hypothetical protein ACT4P6_19220 [Gemmatimonadaceae bacterium]
MLILESHGDIEMTVGNGAAHTHDIGEADGGQAYFITMELVNGTSLRQLIDTEHALPVPATFAIGKAKPSQLTQIGYVAAGVVLYECLTGARPFTADTPAAPVGLKLAGYVKPPYEISAEVPKALSDVIVKALGKDANQRPSNAAEMHDLLVAAES